MGLMQDKNNLDLVLNDSFDIVYEKVLEACNKYGKVKSESKKMGHIMLRTPMKFFSPMNPATVNISLSKKSDETTMLSINTDCYDGTIGLGSVSKIQNQLLKIIKEKLD